MFQSRESRSELIKYQADSGRLLLVTLSSVYSPDGRLPRRGGQRTGHDRADAAPPADGHHLSGLRPARLPPLSALICRLWFARSKSTTCQSATTVENKTVRESCHKDAGMYPRRDGLAAGAAQTIPCLEGGGLCLPPVTPIWIRLNGSPPYSTTTFTRFKPACPPAHGL